MHYLLKYSLLSSWAILSSNPLSQGLLNAKVYHYTTCQYRLLLFTCHLTLPPFLVCVMVTPPHYLFPGMFSLSALLIRLVSGVGLLTLTATVTDTLALYVLPNRTSYRRKMYEDAAKSATHQKTSWFLGSIFACAESLFLNVLEIFMWRSNCSPHRTSVVINDARLWDAAKCSEFVCIIYTYS